MNNQDPQNPLLERVDLNKTRRLELYKRILHVLEQFVENDCNDKSVTAGDHTITMWGGKGICSVMKYMGSYEELGFDAYDYEQYSIYIPELYKVGLKHECNFTTTYWFKFNGEAIYVYPKFEYETKTLNVNYKVGYEKRIAFMKEVIEEALKS